MNLPNRLTLLRVFLIPVFMLFAVPLPDVPAGSPLFEFIGPALGAYNRFAGENAGWLAGAVFVLASLTDALDGYIARRYNLITDFGKFLDPLADKLLVSAALIALTARQEVSAWAAVIIISREFIVTGLRLLAVNRGVVLAAGKLGKLKMVFQTAALTLTLFHNFSLPLLNTLRADAVLMFAAVLLTIVSGLDYLLRNRELFRL
jgi:CDP-diacylglycerol--glycerol-3-phosphate 3-phosphatidyltransferase